MHAYEFLAKNSSYGIFLGIVIICHVGMPHNFIVTSRKSHNFIVTSPTTVGVTQSSQMGIIDS
jgi:hypothetical protein